MYQFIVGAIPGEILNQNHESRYRLRLGFDKNISKHGEDILFLFQRQDFAVLDRISNPAEQIGHCHRHVQPFGQHADGRRKGA